jgi:threonine synthase
MSKYIYKCSICGREYSSDKFRYTCEDCGNDGLLDIIYDYESIKDSWVNKESRNAPIRYQNILPISHDNSEIQYFVGDSPIYKLKKWEQEFSQKELFLLDDGRGPTASYKDRASIIAVLKAKELGEKIITCASTGNAASSLAGACAAFGIKSYIFVPVNAPIGKLVQLIMFGANIFRIKGSYDTAFDLCLKATEKFGWYNRNTGYNPVLLEGKKTSSLEIYEKIGVPDRIYIPVGDGCIFSGIYKGFSDLKSLGLIEKMPFFVGVQAEGSSPYVIAQNDNYKLTPVEANTIADSISVGVPRVFSQAIRIAKNNEGYFMSVSDDEIMNAQSKLSRDNGVFVEPAASAAVAGFIKERQENKFSSNEKVIIIGTGNGLKDTNSVLSRVSLPEPVEPDLLEVEKRL